VLCCGVRLTVPARPLAEPIYHCCRAPCCRRDLESARTLADQIRKREKLKRRELQLYKEEWAARMQGG
jgi:hypothetical protein